MKKTLQTRLCALLTALALLPSSAHGYDFEVDSIFYNITTDTEVEVTYVSKYNGSYSGDIVIPETITYHDSTYTVTSIGDYAFQYCTSLTSITLPEGLTSIGDYAFRNCSSLTSITLSESLTSIGSYAFYGCTSLTSITLSEGLTSIGSYAFYGCTGLTSISLPESLTSIGSYAFYGCTSLTSISLPDGITSLGSYAFYSCTGLISITLPEGLTSISEGIFCGCTSLSSITLPGSLTSIGDYAFEGCTSLTSVTLPESLTSIGSCAFEGCTSLSSITLPESLTSIGSYAFCGCTSLTSISLPDGITSLGSYAFYSCTDLISITLPEGLTSISEGIFSGCTSLSSITLPGSLTSIGNYAFEGCTSLTSVTLPDGITSLGSYAFYGCTGLTSISLPESLTSIGNYAFYGCTSLTSITLPESLTSIGNYAFQNCTGLTSISLPESLTSIGSYVFDNCTGLTSITLPESLTSIGNYAFRNCTSLTSISLPENLTSIGNSAFYGCTSLTSISLPDNLSSIGSYAFYGCTSLKSITLPESLTSIGSYAFYGFTGLESITLPENLTSIGSYAFYGCSSLTSITLPESLTSIGSYAFSGCTGLTSITLPESLTSISQGMFYNCTSLTSISLTESLTSIGNSAFFGCTSLTSITLPESLTSIGSSAFDNCTSLTSITLPESLTSISQSMFEGCTSLTSISLPDSITSIGSYAFYGCTGLTSISLPDSLTSIGSYAFRNCTSLTSITLPESLTSIEKYAFYNCSSLTSITLPDGLTSIGSYAFYGCTGLTSIYSYPATPPSAYSSTFSTSTYSSATLHVLVASSDDYASTSPWSSFTTISGDIVVTDTSDTLVVDKESLLLAIEASTSTYEAAFIGDGIYLIPTETGDVYAAAIAAAQAVYDDESASDSLISATYAALCAADSAFAAAQVNLPSDTALYAFQHAASGLYLAIDEEATETYSDIILSEDEYPFYIVMRNDSVLLESQSGEYICHYGSNTWTMGTSIEGGSTGQVHSFTITPYAETDSVVLYALICAYNSLSVGSDSTTAGANLFDDKEVGEENALWIVCETQGVAYFNAQVALAYALQSEGYALVAQLDSAGATVYADSLETVLLIESEFSTVSEVLAYIVVVEDAMEEGEDVLALVTNFEELLAAAAEEAYTPSCDICDYISAAEDYATAGYGNLDECTAWYTLIDSALINLRTALSNLSAGDTLISEGTTWYVGKELTVNGSFDELPSDHDNDIYGWTLANKYKQMTTGYFTWHNTGGYDDGAYISSKYSRNATSNYSIAQRWSINDESSYRFSFWTQGMTSANRYIVVSITDVTSTTGGENEDNSLIGQQGDSTTVASSWANWREDGSWCYTGMTFDSEECTWLQFNARWLDGLSFDGFSLRQLYNEDSCTKLLNEDWPLLVALGEELGETCPWDTSAAATSLFGFEEIEVGTDGSGDYRITSIDLSSLNLTQIPLKSLTFPCLKSLDLSDNALAGDLATTLAALDTTEYPALTSLISIDISDNDITGNAGVLAAFLPSLTALQASGNGFTDVYPAISSTVTQLDLSDQDMDVTVSVDLSDINVMTAAQQLPTILFYDHEAQGYTTDLELEIASRDGEWAVVLSYADAVASFELVSEQNAYYGTSGDTLIVTSVAETVAQGSTLRMIGTFDMGDVNFIDGVDATDLQATILYIFGEYTELPFNFTAADTYTDLLINVQDVVCTANILLASDDESASGKRRANDLASTSETEAYMYVQEGNVILSAGSPVAALSVKAEGDILWDFSPWGLEQATSGSNVVAYSLSGATIPVGDHVVGTCSSGATLRSASLSDENARKVGVSLTNGSATAINGIDMLDNDEAMEIFSPSGVRQRSLQQGINIIRINGKTIKVLNK